MNGKHESIEVQKRKNLTECLRQLNWVIKFDFAKKKEKKLFHISKP